MKDAHVLLIKLLMHARSHQNVNMHKHHHVLHPLFPPLLERRPGLRSRHHPFKLPPKDDKNYIPRVLFRSLTNKFFLVTDFSLVISTFIL